MQKKSKASVGGLEFRGMIRIDRLPPWVDWPPSDRKIRNLPHQFVAVAVHYSYVTPHTLFPVCSATDLTEALESDGSDYHVERIEKQCQMLAGGGSLFVTSSRSFLMGLKRKESF
jgi:hypothetical protein